MAIDCDDYKSNHLNPAETSNKHNKQQPLIWLIIFVSLTAQIPQLILILLFSLKFSVFNFLRLNLSLLLEMPSFSVWMLFSTHSRLITLLKSFLLKI